MAYHRVGNATEARRALDEAARTIDRWTDERFRCVPGSLSVLHRGAIDFWPIAWWDWMECRHYYHEALRLIDGVAPPDDPRLGVLRARAFAGLRRNAQADLEYARVLKFLPEDHQVRLEAHRTRAYRWIDEGQWGAAAAEFARAAELDPGDIDLWRSGAVAELAAENVRNRSCTGACCARSTTCCARRPPRQVVARPSSP
jgi:tetratricopeptide (TPR) repeat protein